MSDLRHIPVSLGKLLSANCRNMITNIGSSSCSTTESIPNVLNPKCSSGATLISMSEPFLTEVAFHAKRNCVSLKRVFCHV